ncbi:MAG: hypothetical protein U0798_08250 [Gemmataceae bacterium]
MFTMTFFTISLVVLAATIAAFSVAVTRSAVAEPVLASPFGRVGTGNAAEDTLEGGLTCRVFPQAKPGEWQVMTCDSLREVEHTLDNLENHGVTEREVVAMTNSCFAVRWKC